MNIISYNKKNEWNGQSVEKEINTESFARALNLCQHGVHTLAVFIDNKNNGIAGKLGSRLVLLFAYPAKLVDRTIKVIVAPIISMIAVCIETFQPLRGEDRQPRWLAIILFPAKVPFLMVVNIVIYAVILLAGALNIFSPIFCFAIGAKASSYYFAQQQYITIGYKGFEEKIQENDRVIIAPYLVLPLPDATKSDIEDILDQKILYEQQRLNFFHKNFWFLI